MEEYFLFSALQSNVVISRTLICKTAPFHLCVSVWEAHTHVIVRLPLCVEL